MGVSKKIEEGNGLIAEFMDYVLYFDDHDYEEVYSHKDDKYRIVRTPPHALKYHESWNDLMPVVEKISKIKCVWDNAEPTIQDTYYPRTFGMLNSETLRPMVRSIHRGDMNVLHLLEIWLPKF